MVTKLEVNVDGTKFSPDLRAKGVDEKKACGLIREILDGYNGPGAGPQGKLLKGLNLTINGQEKKTRKEPPKLSPEDHQGLAEKYRELADDLIQRAKNDPSLCQPWFNDDGEECPPPITLVPQLSRLANQLEAK
ncbi:MAG: hypothetical protein M1575_03305 [Patescibacteria group bacterium]|nr:hypothetical protein [Patescibacteria group bacterium]MCL5095728.1 hypothetical protein [Patescibacteria group bacterium]